jgi:D-amino-acid dehydrogenase
VRVAVIGAGVIGVTTAYELAADGHEVVVFERRGSVAEEASFANAGVLAPGYVTPWAAPGMPAKVLRQFLTRHAAARLRWPLSVADIRWALRFKRAAQMENYVRNRRSMQQLALYSRARLQEITETLELDYDTAQGYTVLLRSEADARLIEPSLGVLRELGQRFEQLNEEGIRKIEPALNPDTRFFGGVHLPQDGVGNCRQFTQLLKAQAQARGVAFRFGQQVLAVTSGSIGGHSLGAPGSGVAVYARTVATEESPTTTLQSSNSGWGSSSPREAKRRPAQTDATQADYFDHVVICAGASSNELLTSLGLKLPLAPVYGYSISAQVREPINAPTSAVMDERYKVAISRLGLRVRVAGSAELGGRAERINNGSVQTLYKVLQDWFPGAANLRRVQTWKGARPMLPDGPPVIGASGTPRIWLNLGHGSSGWGLACGSARVLADQVAGRACEIDADGFGLGRLMRGA